MISARILSRSEAAQRQSWKWIVTYRIGFCSFRLSENRYSDSSGSKWGGARTSTHWDGSKYSEERTGIKCTNPLGQNSANRYGVMCVNDLFQFCAVVVQTEPNHFSWWVEKLSSWFSVVYCGALDSVRREKQGINICVLIGLNKRGAQWKLKWKIQNCKNYKKNWRPRKQVGYLLALIKRFVIWLNPRAGRMKQILRSDRLLKRARSGFPALVPLKKVLFLAIQ